jgi:hypothetical protein
MQETETGAIPILAWPGPRIRSGLPEPSVAHLTEARLAVFLARSIEATPRRGGIAGIGLIKDVTSRERGCHLGRLFY